MDPLPGPSSGISREKDYLYSVLNVPRSASQTEINERHRALSVIFHPDMLHGDHLENHDTALKKFLEIQKAYEVLSDPFLRTVYDILGQEGLEMRWSPELRSKTPEEIRELLNKAKQLRLENLVRPKGHLTCTIDAVSLFDAYLGHTSDPWHKRMANRLVDVRLATISLGHTIQTQLSDATCLALYARVGGRGATVWGTVRHQFSPRITTEARCSLLRLDSASLKAVYEDETNTLLIQSYFSPAVLRMSTAPPLSISLSRKLFPKSFVQGVLSLRSGPSPHLTFNILSPTPFDFNSTSSSEIRLPISTTHGDLLSLRPGSRSGFCTGTRYWSCGLHCDAGGPKLLGEIGVTFSELALQIRLGLESGLLGFAWVFGGSWQNEVSAIAANLVSNMNGVILRLELSYLEQRLTLPIILASDYEPKIAFWTALVPTTAYLLAYHFVFKPQRRAKRLATIRAARKALNDEDSDTRRDYHSTISLLADAARKHMTTEESKDGLIIVDARYGPAENDDDKVTDLSIDVTIPLQALVRNSQLCIPNQQPKSGIQGFYDPAPLVPKSLRIRYLFRGRPHYAEIPDYIPVVLPLAEHAVEPI